MNLRSYLQPCTEGGIGFTLWWGRWPAHMGGFESWPNKPTHIRCHPPCLKWALFVVFDSYKLQGNIVQSNLVNRTPVYTTPSILRHILAWPKFLVHSIIPSFIRLRHAIMRHAESMFCHIKEVVSANVPCIYVMYIKNASIFTWKLLGNFTYHWELNDN